MDSQHQRRNVYGGERQPAGHSPQDDGWKVVSIIGSAGMEMAIAIPLQNQRTSTEGNDSLPAIVRRTTAGKSFPQSGAQEWKWTIAIPLQKTSERKRRGTTKVVSIVGSGGTGIDRIYKIDLICGRSPRCLPCKAVKSDVGP